MQSWQSVLQCVQCGGTLKIEAGSCACSHCRAVYTQTGEAWVFRTPGPNRLLSPVAEGGRDGLVLRLKAWVKRWPGLFAFLNNLTAFTGISAQAAIKSLAPEALILNLGSGVKMIRSGVINIDYDHFKGVSVVADINHLPFVAGSVDAVICESVLEHMPDPRAVVREIARVLKPGGLLYVVTPFMLGYHASPSDFYRWTEFGMAQLLTGFSIKESGAAWGPTVGLISMLEHWLGLILSFGSQYLYQAWSVFFHFLLAPLTWLDLLLVRHRAATENAHGLYFIAVREPLTHA